ncbi:hypothetical protein [Bizionia echini]|nr:hypothetical protein [Bizionia echini]
MNSEIILALLGLFKYYFEYWNPKTKKSNLFRLGFGGGASRY